MNIKTLSLSALMSLALAVPAVYAADSSDMGKEATGGSASDTMDEQSTGSAGQGMRSGSFNEMDANQDGMLTEDELNLHGSTAAGNPGEAKMSGQQTRDMMMEKDTDGDGQLTQDEYESME
ncbi:EF-hand domain-containing protein [Marinobacter sp.]|uniref:EF-hand domain-containing protein n=1 Tax=Marinobacter sp. TaxID=50741 RepID=UPI0034A3045E